MKRKITIITVLILFTLVSLVYTTSAQSPYTISGKVTDKNGKAVSGALILIKTTSTVVKKVYTRADGLYSVAVVPNDYAIIPVASQYWVYIPCYSAVRITNSNSSGNNFIATPSNELLNILPPVPTPTPTPIPSPSPVLACATPSVSIDCAIAHNHAQFVTVEGLWVRREVRPSVLNQKPVNWDVATQGVWVNGTPYPLGDYFVLDMGGGVQQGFYYVFMADQVPMLAQIESSKSATLRVSYDPACGLALDVGLVSTERFPTPTPTP